MEVIHFIKYCLKLEQPVTQTTLREREVITKYAAGVNTAVEIGVFEGVNTVLIGQSINKTGKLFGIDPFFTGRVGLSYQKFIAKLNIARAGLNSKITLIEKLSKDAIDEVPSELDFIFIDGDHSYEGITRDWELYSKKLAINGIMALHDTSVPDFDPSRKELGSVSFFNDTIVQDFRFARIETVDSLNILRRIR